MSTAPTSVTADEATSSVMWTGSPVKVRHPGYCGEHPGLATQRTAGSGCISEFTAESLTGFLHLFAPLEVGLDPCFSSDRSQRPSTGLESEVRKRINQFMDFS